MLAPRPRGALVPIAILVFAALSACKSGSEPKPVGPAQLSVSPVSNGATGTSVPVSIVLKTAENKPVANATVNFQVTAGSGSVSPTTTTTDADGRAQTTLTFGSTPGVVEVTITVAGSSLTRVIYPTAIGPAPATCNSSTALSLNPGEVRAPISQLGVCVAGGAGGAEFALVPFNFSTTFASIASLDFSSSGASTVTTPPLARIPIAGASLLMSSLGAETTPALFATPAGFDTRLREAERRVLAPLIPAARAWRRTAGDGTSLRPSFSTSAAAPYTVGQIVQLNVRSGATFADACETPDMRTGRVVAVTDKAVVIADQANPTGGYTDAEYQSIGVTFDTLVYDLDTKAFGAPQDIDTNGKIILFFTRAVNELTPPNSQSLVGGFFYGRDLFPKAATETLDACPTSNVAELFYLLVPDPNGVVNGNRRDKGTVQRLTISTTAHEFQHLINASRRLYVNTSSEDFEEVWLNEGLSHVAEELLFYRESGLSPRQNIDSIRIRSSQRIVNAYNNDQSSNFGRFRQYLGRPSTSSPYAPDDELWTRGATWSFLRYAADHQGTADGDIWFQLTNSVTEGMNNLQNVFGADVAGLFRDWATSTFTDDVPGTATRWQQPSWHFRSMYKLLTSNPNAIPPNPGTYPLNTVTVGDGSPLNVLLNGGGVAYVRFAVAPGGVASVQWNGPLPRVAMTLVRFK